MVWVADLLNLSTGLRENFRLKFFGQFDAQLSINMENSDRLKNSIENLFKAASFFLAC
jgi:hypothetical protein